MGFFKDFKEFALRGNVVDLAVAVIIGGAFGSIVSSLVDDVITPLLLNPALKAANVDQLDKLMWGSVKYGNFLAAVLKFIVIAFVIFVILRMMTAAMRKKEETPAPPAEPSSTDKLLMDIRDELKKK